MDRYARCATLVVLKLVACAAGWGKPPQIEPAYQASIQIIAILIVICISIFIIIFIFISLFLSVFIIFILIFISFQAGGSPPTSRLILGN